MKKIDIIICLLICILTFLTLRDLYKPFFYTSDDGQNQIVRLYYFDEALRDGQFPPRIAGGLLNGYSYPLFVFSYHMPWIIAEPFYLITRDIFASIKFSFILGYFLSGLTMYWYLKRVFGRFPSTVGTFLYLFAPYRFVNIFVRAAIGDATSFIFPPLIFLSLYELTKFDKLDRMFKTGAKWIVVGAIGIAGLILSHAMVFALFGLFYFLYLLWNLVFTRNKKNTLIGFIVVLILGVALSGYYFIPSFFERDYTQFSSVMRSIFTGSTFIPFKQLVYSPWGYGMMRAEEGGMSFQVGIAQWGVAVFTVLILIKWLISKKNKREYSAYSLGFYFMITFILSVLAMLPVSLFVWKLLGNIIIIDFTWRILTVTVFSSPVLGAFAVSKIKFKYLVGVLIILVALYANRNYLRINKIQGWDVPFYLKLEKTTNMYDEYTPQWVQREIEKVPILAKIGYSSKSVITDIKVNSSNHFLADVTTSQNTEATLNTIYYPGWELFVNNIKSPIEYKNSRGLMSFSLPKGKNTVEFKFTETPLRLISDIITILAGMISLWAVISSFRIKHNEIKHDLPNKSSS